MRSIRTILPRIARRSSPRRDPQAFST